MTNEEIVEKYCSDFNEPKINSDGYLLPKEYIFNEVSLLSAMDAARKNERKPPFIVAEVREYLNQLLNEDITFSRFVELLNTRPKMQKKND